MMPAPTQTVVVTNTQPPPQPYTHPTITTLAPLGRITDTFLFVEISSNVSYNNSVSGVGMPYAVGPYSFVHPHHSIATFSGPMPSHRVTLPPTPHMQMYHPFHHPHSPHPPHPHHSPPVVPAPPPYYTPPPTPGTRHLYTMQQPMPVSITIEHSFYACTVFSLLYIYYVIILNYNYVDYDDFCLHIIKFCISLRFKRE